MLKGKFHSYHIYSCIFSIIAYLFSSFINSSAAQMKLNYVTIGAINFVGAMTYVLASVTFGHVGDRFGHKKFLTISIFVFSVFVMYMEGFSGVIYLFVLASGVNLFFGSFYPQVEGLIAKGEKSFGIDHSVTVTRFNLSWSLGNIFGMAFGPYITVKWPYVIFLFSVVFSLFSGFMVWKDFRKHGDKLYFVPSKTLKLERFPMDFTKIKLYRKVYRVTLFVSGLVYTAILSLFPKVISISGLPLKIAGFVIVAANISVFLTFLVFGKLNIWVGNPKISALFLMVLPLTSILMLLSQNAFTLVLISFFGGMCYAIPYTFAIFYGLNSQENDQGKQGGFHEATIGMLFGFGPLIGGYFLDLFGGLYGLGILGLILSIVVFTIQLIFLKKV
ncbi:MFS transporter [Thermosipho ferrireducens]|uniref:MFS transporter n=1 Tax=Thermosipho ferrireducens TaxID=2571116 RepID=A0ABX7S4D5_9BACT|nr:MFS transporter [Thermosipho ferrireducens]QTA37294.1 MFS transporter [Thermosipho ferrireducens]